MAIGWPTCPPRSARVVWNPVPKNGYEKGTTKEIAYVYRCTTVTYQIHHDSCRDSRHRYSALRALSAQYEQAQQQHAAQVETLQQQVEALEQQVAQLSGRVTPLAQNYRTLTETLRGRWS